MLPGILIVTPPVYPHLVVNNDFSYFSWLLKSLNLESQNQTKNIPVTFPSSTIKMWGKSVEGFLSYDLTNKQR